MYIEVCIHIYMYTIYAEDLTLHSRPTHVQIGGEGGMAPEEEGFDRGPDIAGYFYLPLLKVVKSN